MLIDQLSSSFEPDKYKDDNRSDLMTAIEHKIAGEEVQTSPEAKRTNVIDIMAALRASLDEGKANSKVTGDTNKKTPKSKKEKVPS
jgi:DNA end-binding protein Ku